MKKLSINIFSLFFLISLIQVSSAKSKSANDWKPGWFVGMNLKGGLNNFTVNQTDWTTSYLNAVNANISKVDASSGMAFGIDAKVGYFFGKNRNFGLATGINWMQNRYEMEVEKFAVEYQSMDYNNNAFRQVIRATEELEEEVKMNSFNVPLALLYKTDINKKWGFILDAGVLFNITSSTKYETDGGTFDFEGIYKFDQNGNAVYDNAETPDPTDWLITRAHYTRINPTGDVNAYFNGLKTQGYNVGLNTTTGEMEGDAAKVKLNIGWFVQPGISYKLTDNFVLHGQVFVSQVKAETENTSNNYTLTNKIGQYNSMTNGITDASHLVTGVNLGFRYYFGKKEEPKKEVTPETVNVQIKLIDEKYGKPVVGQIVIMQGKKVVYDGKSDASGTSSFQLLPGEYKIDVSAKGYIPAEEDLDISKATKGTTQTIELKQPKIEKGLEFKLKSINFETGSDKLTNSSGDILNLMASMLKEYPQMIVEVAGYSDNVGDANKNLELSKKRAESVKAYLIGKGAKESQLKSIGYGEAKPIASNDTEEGRKQNRRVMFTVLEF